MSLFKFRDGGHFLAAINQTQPKSKAGGSAAKVSLTGTTWSTCDVIFLQQLCRVKYIRPVTQEPPITFGFIGQSINTISRSLQWVFHPQMLPEFDKTALNYWERKYVIFGSFKSQNHFAWIKEFSLFSFFPTHFPIRLSAVCHKLP